MLAKDVRVKTMAEILSGIKILKLYSWENLFENKVSYTVKQPFQRIIISYQIKISIFLQSL